MYRLTSFCFTISCCSLLSIIVPGNVCMSVHPARCVRLRILRCLEFMTSGYSSTRTTDMLWSRPFGALILSQSVSLFEWYGCLCDTILLANKSGGNHVHVQNISVFSYVFRLLSSFLFFVVREYDSE